MARTLLVYDNVVTIFPFATNEFTIGDQPGYALDMSDATKTIFTIKNELTDDDDDALVQINTDDGLTYIAGSAATEPTDGSLTANATTLDVVLKANSAQLLEDDVGTCHYWDIKKIVDGEPIIEATGTVVFTLTPTRALA